MSEGSSRSLEVGKAREIGWSPVGSGSGRREEIFNSMGLASSSCMSWEWQWALPLTCRLQRKPFYAIPAHWPSRKKRRDFSCYIIHYKVN